MSQVRKGQDMNRTDCPSDERLAAYLDGALSEKSRKDLEDHVLDCSSCSEVLAAANEANRAHDTEAARSRLIERAKALFPKAKVGQKRLHLPEWNRKK